MSFQIDLLGTPLPTQLKSWAVFSPCRQWRYELWREWDAGKPYCMFIGLNPSTADETKDDPTVRRCIAYAKAWGYGSLCMTNIFGWRDTDPAKMKLVPDPVGQENDSTLRRIAAGAGLVIAAWGTHGSHMGRAEQVLQMLPNLMCLSRNKDGSPGHPLYLRADAKPVPLTAVMRPNELAKAHGWKLRAFGWWYRPGEDILRKSHGCWWHLTKEKGVKYASLQDAVLKQNPVLTPA